MTEPIDFASNTPRHGLPFLIAGQAQKEFFVNEAFTKIDMLLHPVVEDELAAPPASPGAGECWLVAPGPSGLWVGHEGDLAAWDGTQWTFTSPNTFMAVFVRSSGRLKYYRDGWQWPGQPAAPTGGTTIDAEARPSLAQVLQVLKTAGLMA